MCLPHPQNMAEYMSAWRGTRYWCDGVLTLAVGGIGFVGNIFSILILSSRYKGYSAYYIILLSLQISVNFNLVHTISLHTNNIDIVGTKKGN